jgi:two-component system, NtrC family, response regulator GlrR
LCLDCPGVDSGVTVLNAMGQSAAAGLQMQCESVAVNPASMTSKTTAAVARIAPHLIFLNLSTSNFQESAECAKQVLNCASGIPVLVVHDRSQPDEMIELLKLGVADYLIRPLHFAHIVPRLWRLLQHSRPSETLSRTLMKKVGLQHCIGQNPQFVVEMGKVPLLATSDVGILILGETGTGKELCARSIHYLSPRADQPFIPVNCGAIPVELAENELFGHERGAYTGASRSQAGLVTEAQGGTLFLDEIDCLAPLIQVKLLRFLQDREYRPLGGAKARQADVRVIAATNADPAEILKTGRLRRDLYYRLNVIPIRLPPLRERRDDIPLLAEHFLRRYAAERRVNKDFSAQAIRKLQAYDWPGNVRELEHLVQRVVVLSRQSVIEACEIPVADPPVTPAPIGTFRHDKAQSVAAFEKHYLRTILQSHQGNITKAARAAGKNRRAFWELIRKHKISVDCLKPSLPSDSSPFAQPKHGSTGNLGVSSNPAPPL